MTQSRPTLVAGRSKWSSDNRPVDWPFRKTNQSFSGLSCGCPSRRKEKAIQSLLVHRILELGELGIARCCPVEHLASKSRQHPGKMDQIGYGIAQMAIAARDIYRMHYIEGFGTRRIAGILNQRGVRAARGGKWAQGQVESVAYNEDYTGRGIANRKSSAIYHRRRSARPEPIEVDPKILYNVSRIKPIVRPIEDWFESAEPYMIEFLGNENLRQITIDRQIRYWKRRLDPTWTRKNKKRYSMSPYLLTDILMSKPDGEKLVGSRCGKVSSPKRIYRHKRGQREAGRGNVFGRVLDADSLEAAVLAVLQEILLDWPAIESSLQHHVQHHLRAAEQGDEIFSAKQREREEANDQLRLLVRMLSPKTQQDLAPELARWETKRDLLDIEIANLRVRSIWSARGDKNSVAACLLHGLAFAVRLDDEFNFFTLLPISTKNCVFH